jgi:DNA-binding CsgD family transcriptional regulator
MIESPLSAREHELLNLVATGASNKEISNRLNISVNTVKVHLRNIFKKLGVASRTEAAMWAVQNGLVEVGEERVDTDEFEVTKEPEDSGRSWYQFLPIRLRPWIPAVGAVILILVGYVVSIFFRPQPEPQNQSQDVISAAEFEESRWKQLADMPTARAGLAAAVYDNHIYAIAGEGVDGPVAVNERYDPQTDTWEILTPKSVPVQDVQAGVIGGRIYIPGGWLAVCVKYTC